MNYETLKYGQEGPNKWRDIYCPWMGMLDIVDTSFPQIYL